MDEMVPIAHRGAIGRKRESWEQQAVKYKLLCKLNLTVHTHHICDWLL